MSQDIPVSMSSVETIDIESFVREGKPIPKGKKYRVRIDRELFVFDHHIVTGRELLEKAGKIPYQGYMISQKFPHGQTKRLGYEEKVNLSEDGVERFVTLPLDQTEGDGSRDFNLSSDDTSFLDSSFKRWEAFTEGAAQWLLLHGFKIPLGFTVDEATLALEIPITYPDTQIDMAYFYPALQLQTNRQINALSTQNISGNEYQRWSRHRKSPEEWRSDVDNVSTHVQQVTFWLEKEVGEL